MDHTVPLLQTGAEGEVPLTLNNSNSSNKRISSVESVLNVINIKVFQPWSSCYQQSTKCNKELHWIQTFIKHTL